MRRVLASILLLGLTATGCAGTISPTARIDRLRDSQSCARVPERYRGTESRRAGLVDATIPEDTPDDVARVARAAELTEALTGALGPAELAAEVFLLQAQVASALSEADCLEDYLEELQAELSGRRQRTEVGLTVASIVVGAAAAVGVGVAELVDNESLAVPSIGIGGGVASAVLGLIAVSVPAPTVSVRHERNVLRALWQDGDDSRLPPFVWRLLGEPREEDRSPRESLRARWRSLIDEVAGPDQVDRARLEALLFGDGGEYGVRELALRNTMIDHLETEIDLMNQEVERFLRYLLRHTPSGE